MPYFSSNIRRRREEQWEQHAAMTSQRPQLSRENSVTEEIVENYPTELQRTLSDSFLPRGRPPNKRS